MGSVKVASHLHTTVSVATVVIHDSYDKLSCKQYSISYLQNALRNTKLVGEGIWSRTIYRKTVTLYKRIL